MDALREQTIGDVRACLVSAKERSGSLDMHQLASDYQTLVHHPIRYRELGFGTLEAFLRTVDCLNVSKQANGQVLVEATTDPRSAHIRDMVSRQKPSKTKKQRGSAPPGPCQQLPSHVPKRWRPSVPANKHKMPNARGQPPHTAQKQQFPQTAMEQPPEARNFNTYLRDMERIQISPEQQSRPPANKENQLPPAVLKDSERSGGQSSAAHSEKTNLCLVMQRAKAANLASTRTPSVCSDFERRQSEDRIRTNLALGDAEDRNSFVESGNVGKDLWNFTRFHRIAEPQVIVMERKSKPHRRTQFDCKIKVDGTIYSSYPEDFLDENSATTFASKLALEKLIEKYGRTRLQSILVASESAVVERVPDLVEKHFNGVWSRQVEVDYKDLYSEVLPTNWLQIIGACSVVTVEQFGDKFVLRPCTIENTSVTFDENGCLTARVTCSVSAGEIWCRQLGTQAAATFDSMLEDMNRYYQEQYEHSVIQSEEQIVKDCYYAAWNQTWHRARVLEMRADGVLCALVDSGETLLLPSENIYALQRRYARERAQAFVCKLAGLDDLYEASRFTEAIGELEGADVTLRAVGDADNEDSRKIYNVVMYDFEATVAYNEELRVLIGIEITTNMFEAGKTFEVHISHNCQRDGLLHVQVCSAGFDVLSNMLKQLEDELPKLLAAHGALEPITRDNCEGKIYLIKLDLDDRYHRVQINDSHPSFEFAQLFFIDTGNDKVVKMSDVSLYPLEVLSAPLNNFPPQATLVRMYFEERPDDLPTKMKLLPPETETLLLRVHDEGANGVPNVMLFVPQPNGLVSLNDSFSMEKYNRDVQSLPLGRFTPPDSPHNVPSTGNLQSPRLPNAREYYEVKIPCAVNPWNFFVQPLDSANLLSDMMSRLQATFANRHTDPVNLKDIKAGNIYAAKHNDGMWCRVCVLKTIYPSAIVVFYVDFGSYANLSYQDLYALDKQFLELPYQAIKAKLAGIKPILDKWSVDDCRAFEKLVLQREYVSVIISEEQDKLYPCDNVLILKLIDTRSSQQDVLIGDLLIQKKIAVKD